MTSETSRTVVSTSTSYDHFLKLSGALLLWLGEVVQYTSALGGYTTVGQDSLKDFFIILSSSPAYHP